MEISAAKAEMREEGICRGAFRLCVVCMRRMTKNSCSAQWHDHGGRPAGRPGGVELVFLSRSAGSATSVTADSLDSASQTYVAAIHAMRSTTFSQLMEQILCMYSWQDRSRQGMVYIVIHLTFRKTAISCPPTTAASSVPCVRPKRYHLHTRLRSPASSSSLAF